MYVLVSLILFMFSDAILRSKDTINCYSFFKNYMYYVLMLLTVMFNNGYWYMYTVVIYINIY